MFSKSDFISYVSEIEMLERNMHDTYVELAGRVTDEKIKKAFEQLAKEEEIHSHMVEKLRRMLIKASME